MGLVRPEYFTAAGNQVFFQVSTSQGLRLWHSDGTPAGTGPVDTFERPVAAAMTELGGKLLYAAEGGLYLTDGTRGTQLVASTGYSTNFGGTPHLFRAGDQVWFMNGENWRRGDGRGGLWRTDGTAPGTLQVLPNVLVNNFFRFGDRVWLGGLRLVVDLSVNPLEPHATGITDPPWPYQPYYPPFTLAELGSFVCFPNAQGLYRTAVPDHYLANVSLKLFNDADGDGTHDPSEGVYTSPALDAYVDLDNDGPRRRRTARGGACPRHGPAHRRPRRALPVRLSENGPRFTTPPTFAIDVAGVSLKA